jgi:hypothetical protein
MSPAALEAIEVADAQVNNFGLPTYTRMLWVLREFYALGWLDADTGSESLEAAKAEARAIVTEAREVR